MELKMEFCSLNTPQGDFKPAQGLRGIEHGHEHEDFTICHFFETRGQIREA
jgi:hypothetical protein